MLQNVVRIQYGGSMKPSNAEELLSQADIDGGLIGGASLDAVSFGSLIDSEVEYSLRSFHNDCFKRYFINFV